LSFFSSGISGRPRDRGPCIVYFLVNGLPLDLIAQPHAFTRSIPFRWWRCGLSVRRQPDEQLPASRNTFTNLPIQRPAGFPAGWRRCNIFGSLIFAGMSGSALAISAASAIEIDAMRSKGFNPAFAGAVTASSALVGPIFPPSIPLIIYGTVTGVSVISFCSAAFCPDFFCVLMLMLMTGWLAVRRKISARAPLADLRRTLARLLAGLSGIMAPRHSDLRNARRLLHPDRDRVGDGGLCLAHQRAVLSRIDLAGSDLRRVRDHPRLGWHSADVAVAALFGWILSVEQVPQTLTGWMLSISTNPAVLLLLVNILFVIVGMFLDTHHGILVVAPIIAKP
jgi:TRAP-type uncharacterized transport system fused permease subunit